MYLEVCSRCQSGPLLIPVSLRKIQADGSTDLFAPTEAPEMKARCCHSEGRRSGGWFSRIHSKVFIPEIHFMSLNFKYIFGFLTLCWKLKTQRQVTVTSAL